MATPRPLEDLVTQLAEDVVRVQSLLDQAVAAQRQSFAQTLALVPPEWQDLYAPLVPAAQVIREYSLSCALTVGTRRSLRFSLSVSPLSLGMSSLLQTTGSECSSITVQVSRVPLPLFDPAARPGAG